MPKKIESAEKPVIVMIPGLGSDRTVWQPTIDELGPDFECQVGDTLKDTSLSAIADRILSQMPKNAVLSGVSMGGMIALEIVRKAPERVSQLVLLDTNPNPDTEEQRIRREQINSAMAKGMDLTAQTRASISFMLDKRASADLHQKMMDMSLRLGPEPYVRQNKAVIARDDQRPVLPTIQVPTLIIYGENDQMTPVALGRQLAAAISGSTLHIIPECGHLPPIEKPIVVASLLRDFVSN